MTATTAPPPVRALGALLAVAGPAAIGASLGLRADVPTLLSNAAWMPLIVLGVMALMLPGLYIASAFADIAPPARDVARGALRALEALGLCALGLAPALAFLVSTSTSAVTNLVLGHVVLALAAMLGLTAFYRSLFADRPAVRAVPLFGFWALLTVAIGWRFFLLAIAGV